MDYRRKIELLQEQIDEAASGKPSNFEEWNHNTEVVLRTIFGEVGKTYSKFKRVRFSPGVITSSTNFDAYRRKGVQEAIALLKSAQREVELMDEFQQNQFAEEVEKTIEVTDKGAGKDQRIFIVHGHDEAKKHQLARFLRDLTGHEPVILHEQPNKGSVLIQKLETNAQKTGFAVVLLTADDDGKAKKDSKYRSRARQNVVFELGFFIAALGRENVAVLMEEGVEEPGDVTGLVYTPLDPAGAWKALIANEIEASGISVQWTALRR